jgi:hypothetical protein
MTPSTPAQDVATQWNIARQLYPTYLEMAREFAIEIETCPALETGADTPGKEAIEQASRWLGKMDECIQVHQLRQFLQTSSLGNQDALLNLIKHFLGKAQKNDAIRDKIDFVLVQYFSQMAPTGIEDSKVDLAFVAKALEPLLGPVELKSPVWLNALDRVLELARKSRTLDELLHGGVLEQGRKAKSQAGELFYLPVALAAFTRFGYLMRRSFFRLMLGDLNTILDGLATLEEKGVQTIDCRRAQFSAQEPIVRLRMICQSWKVMFQAEYSSGQPLRMLVDLRASVDAALGKNDALGKDKEKAPAADANAKPAPPTKPSAPAAKPIAAAKPVAATRPSAGKPAVAAAKAAPAAARAAAASAGTTAAVGTPKPGVKPTTQTTAAKPKVKAAAPVASSAAEPEFEVSGTPGWESETEAPSKPAPQGKKKN